MPRGNLFRRVESFRSLSIYACMHGSFERVLHLATIFSRSSQGMLAICPSEECLSSLRRVLLRQVIDLEHLSSESCSRRGKVVAGHLHRVPISGTPLPGYPQRECLLLSLHIQRSIFREQSRGTSGHLERDATPRYITPSLLLTVNPYAGLRSRYSSPKMVRPPTLSASDQ